MKYRIYFRGSGFVDVEAESDVEAEDKFINGEVDPNLAQFDFFGGAEVCNIDLIDEG